MLVEGADLNGAACGRSPGGSAPVVELGDAPKRLTWLEVGFRAAEAMAHGLAAALDDQGVQLGPWTGARRPTKVLLRSQCRLLAIEVRPLAASGGGGPTTSLKLAVPRLSEVEWDEVVAPSMQDVITDAENVAIELARDGRRVARTRLPGEYTVRYAAGDLAVARVLRVRPKHTWMVSNPEVRALDDVRAPSADDLALKSATHLGLRILSWPDRTELDDISRTHHGEYSIVYEVSAGRAVFTFERRLSVIDSEPPEIELLLPSCIGAAPGSKVQQPSSRDVIVTNGLLHGIDIAHERLGPTNAIDSSIGGTWRVTYTAADAAGNTVVAHRVVVVDVSSAELPTAYLQVYDSDGRVLARTHAVRQQATPTWNTRVAIQADDLQWTAAVFDVRRPSWSATTVLVRGSETASFAGGVVNYTIDDEDTILLVRGASLDVTACSQEFRTLSDRVQLTRSAAEDALVLVAEHFRLRDARIRELERAVENPSTDALLRHSGLRSTIVEIEVGAQFLVDSSLFTSSCSSSGPSTSSSSSASAPSSEPSSAPVSSASASASASSASASASSYASASASASDDAASSLGC